MPTLKQIKHVNMHNVGRLNRNTQSVNANECKGEAWHGTKARMSTDET